MQAIDADQFDKCAQDLEANGYALLPLPSKIRTSISNSFETARTAISSISAENDSTINVPMIDPVTDSANWTGYHCATERNGRYNKFREGFVFSNGEMFDVECKSGGGCSDQKQGPVANFGNQMIDMFHIMHNVIADGMLQAIERRLQLPRYYFRDEMGPAEKASQWHLKRYDVDAFLDSHEGLGSNEILPVHTDPSLISVVILDVRGVNAGGMGLQVFHPKNSTWKEISHHGHGITIIFVGSVLSHLTKSQLYPAAKHKVVQWWTDGSPMGSQIDSNKHQRVAATLFVRPQADALMKPLPSPLLQFDGAVKKCVTFRQWNARVARNYMKRKKQTT